MKIARNFLLVLLIALVFVGCAAHTYQMGSGPQGNEVVQARQWYALWGLVQIGDADITGMIGDAQNYEVRTAQEPVDVVINIFTSYITVTSRTVTVKK